MCRTVDEGGRRCAMSQTVNSRRVVAQRLKRHTEAGKVTLAARDADILARLDAARAHYGPVVTVMDMDLPATVHEVCGLFRDAGLQPLIVGGSVRDALIDGRAPKDIDVEVYGGTIDDVAALLRTHYRVDEVGRSFGVLKAVLGDGTDLDISVPRRDNHTGAGHRGFTVDTDITMTADEAAARRDFTINAMGYDPEYGVCVDPFHGRDDLDTKTLRATSEAFAEDPLRVLRGFQFGARYAMTLDPETAQVCRDLIDRAHELPVERVRGEWAKFYTKGTHTGHGLAVLAETGWDTTVPGLATVNTEKVRTQVNVATQNAIAAGLDASERERLIAATIAATMSDDDAKAFTRHTIDGGDAQKAAYGLSRATLPGTGTPTGIRNWAHLLGRSRTTIREWTRLETVTGNAETARRVLADAERLGCADGPQPDLILGRDIIARFPDRRPGPWTGQIQRMAREAQIDGVFTTREAAEWWLVNANLPD